MLRMTLLLCATMVGALLIMGEDRGQMRPGLAKAAAEGPAPAVDPQAQVAEAAPRPTPVVEPAAEPVAAAEALATAEVVAPEPERMAYVEPPREVVRQVEEPIFTLSVLGNELVPGESSASATSPGVAPAASDVNGGGTIWYVNASSVNVRAEPSTQADVVGRLANGEAALMVSAVDDEWARIVIQGDGMEGFVALRYLTPEAP